MLIDLLVVFAVAIAAGGVASISGFGVGSLLTPLLALRVDLQLAVAAVSIPHLLGTALRFALIHKNINKEVFVRFGIWSAVGGLVGAVIGAGLRDRALIVVLAVLLIFAGGTGAFGFSEKLRCPPKLGWLAGIVSGAFGGLVGNQGGLRSAALMGFNLPKNEFVATATGIGLIVDGARMPVYFFYQWKRLGEHWLPILIATAGVLLGTWIGQLALNKIPEPVFKRVVCGIILLLGVAMLFKSP